MPPVLRVVVALSLVACLPAQYGLNESRGLLAGAPTAVLVDGGLAAGTDAETRVHRSGFQAGLTVPLPVAVNPPDLRAILALHGAPLGPPWLDIDDISLGRDEILVAGAGIVTVPPTSWGVLSFSLRQGATGVGTSRIAQEAALGSIGAALFSWVLPGSNLPPQVIARTERSHSRQDLGLPLGVDVDAVDFPLMLGREQTGLAAVEPGFAPLIGQPEAIYFTVSHATRTLVPAAWWSGAPAANMSGATVLRVLRSSPGTPWGPPHVYCTWQDLGLTQNEDVDGLAVDDTTQKVLFSCTGTVRDQFLFIDLSVDGAAAPSTVTSSGTPVSQQVGKAQNDDIDAICTLDPVIGTNGGPPPGGDDFGSSCGAPRPGLLGVPAVHASAFRARRGAQTFFDTWMVGWPPLTGATAGVAIPFVTVGVNPTLFLLGPIVLRNPADPNPGNPCSTSLAIPAGPLLLSGASVTFRWAAFDAGFTELAEAWPVQVFL